jgi:hypothetical protein
VLRFAQKTDQKAAFAVTGCRAQFSGPNQTPQKRFNPPPGLPPIFPNSYCRHKPLKYMGGLRVLVSWVLWPGATKSTNQSVQTNNQASDDWERIYGRRVLEVWNELGTSNHDASAAFAIQLDGD